VRDELASITRDLRALEGELLRAAGVETGAPDPDAVQQLPLFRDGRTGLLSLVVTDHGALALLLTRDGVQHTIIEHLTADGARALIQGTDEDPEWGGWLGAYFPQFEAARAYRDTATWATLMPESEEHRRERDRTRAAWQATVSRWRETITQTLNTLGERLWPGLARLLQEAGVKRVMLIPQGTLFLLPLHACPLGDQGPVDERYTVGYAPAGAVLARVAGEEAAAQLTQPLLVVNPTGDLRHTPSEALAVRRALGSAAALWEREATQARVVAAAREAGVVHFSGHGVYDWRAPERSGLLLRDPDVARVNVRTGAGVDPLTVAEMRRALRLSHTRLVTLSACETGLVEIRRGLADEYIGLPGVLLQAGARAVVASLWAVDDLATALLMGRFYAEWQEGAVSIAQALLRAQRWLRTRTREQVEEALDELDALWRPWAEQCDDPAMQRRARGQYWEILAARKRLERMDEVPFAHPYWWAAFQAVGDVL